MAEEERKKRERWIFWPRLDRNLFLSEVEIMPYDELQHLFDDLTVYAAHLEAKSGNYLHKLEQSHANPIVAEDVYEQRGKILTRLQVVRVFRSAAKKRLKPPKVKRTPTQKEAERQRQLVFTQRARLYDKALINAAFEELGPERFDQIKAAADAVARVKLREWAEGYHCIIDPTILEEACRHD